MHYPIIHAVLETNQETFGLPTINELKESLPEEDEFLNEVQISDYCFMDTSEKNSEDHSDIREAFENDSLFVVEDVDGHEEFFKVAITLDTLKQHERELNNLKRQYIDLVDKGLDNNIFVASGNVSSDVFTDEERDIIYDYLLKTSTSGDTVISLLYDSSNSLQSYGFFSKSTLIQTAKYDVSKTNDFVFYVTTAFIGDYHY